METPSKPPSHRPGSVLRQLRNEHGWTLKELSRRTHLTISTLSKLENDKMSLTYDKMMRIATGLNIDIGILFAIPEETSAAIAAPETSAAPGRRSVTRAEEGRVIETDTAVQHYPATDFLNKQLVPVIFDLKARSRQEFGDLLRHPGEEYVLVLEGAIELHSEFYAPVRLEVGDSIYFDSNMAHGYIAAAEGRCRILSVSSTADWGIAASAAPSEETSHPPYLQVVRAAGRARGG